MVKLKKRYLVVEILPNDEGHLDKITGSGLFHAIENQVANLYGDFGVGSLKTTLQIKVCDTSANISVIRVSTESCNMVTSSLPFIVFMGTSRCSLNLLHKGASMRTVERFLFERNLRSLYEKLISVKTPVEKAEVQKAIHSFTGSKVVHMKF